MATASVFIDYIDDGFNDKGFYGEWYPTLSFGKMSGRTVGGGPLPDVALICDLGGINFGGDADFFEYLPGVRLSPGGARSADGGASCEKRVRPSFCLRPRGERGSADGTQRSQDDSDRHCGRGAGAAGVHGACLPVMRASTREEKATPAFGEGV